MLIYIYIYVVAHISLCTLRFKWRWLICPLMSWHLSEKLAAQLPAPIPQGLISKKDATSMPVVNFVYIFVFVLCIYICVVYIYIYNIDKWLLVHTFVASSPLRGQLKRRSKMVGGSGFASIQASWMRLASASPSVKVFFIS